MYSTKQPALLILGTTSLSTGWRVEVAVDIEKQRSTRRGQPQMPVLVFFGDNLCIDWIDNAVRVLSHASFINYPGMLFVKGI